MPRDPHVLIVGGGFAGLTAARTLRGAPVRITLVDRNNVQAANGLVRASAEALRVVGLISLVHRGSHATGLILIAPLFAVFATRTVFWGAAVTLPLVGLLSLAAVGAARARAQD